MPFTDPSVHHVNMVTAEMSPSEAPAGVTIHFDQVPRIGPSKADLDVYLSSDQDAADAYLLAAAINCSTMGTDDLEDRRRRAAMALGWVYEDEADDHKGGWKRPAREGDGGMLRLGGAGGAVLWANDVEQALRHDLEDFF